jgi:hypothetical protein
MVSHGRTDALGLMVDIEVGLLCTPLHHHAYLSQMVCESFRQISVEQPQHGRTP